MPLDRVAASWRFYRAVKAPRAGHDLRADAHRLPIQEQMIAFAKPYHNAVIKQCAGHGWSIPPASEHFLRDFLV